MAKADDVLREKVKAHLDDNGISQRRMARELGMSAPWANMWMKGKRSIPLVRAEKVAAFLGRNLLDLLADGESDPLARGAGVDSVFPNANGGADGPTSARVFKLQARALQDIATAAAGIGRIVNNIAAAATDAVAGRTPRPINLGRSDVGADIGSSARPASKRAAK